MTSQLTAYIALVCTSGVLNLYLCLNVFFNRFHYTKIANFFIFYTAVITIYCVSSAFGLMSTTIEQVKFWTTIQYIGLPFSPPLGLLFIMGYLGIKMTKKRVTALLILPFITLIIVATNDFHLLHYRVLEIDAILGAPFTYMEIGVWYIIHGFFTFGCMFVAFLLLLSRWRETAKEYRPQLVALLFGQFVPMVTAFLYLIGLTPPGFDPVPLVLWLTSLLYLWAIRSSRMFTVMPMAKDAIFHSINDGVIVLDESYRLVEFNEASKRMFPNLEKKLFGVNFNEIWLQLTEKSFQFNLETTDQKKEDPLLIGNSYYQVRFSSFQHGNYSKGLLIIFTDITVLKKLQEKLEQQAYFDDLTKIYNRRAFLGQCENKYTIAKQNSLDFTVILFDIDLFKKVNDTYGHNIGDQLLVHVVHVCQAQLREGDLFARYGGEEFVIALEDGSITEAEKLANQLRWQLENQPLVCSEGEITVTISLGVAQTTKEKAETLYHIINNADHALYTAKREGRNQVRVFEITTPITK